MTVEGKTPPPLTRRPGQDLGGLLKTSVAVLGLAMILATVGCGRRLTTAPSVLIPKAHPVRFDQAHFSFSGPAWVADPQGEFVWDGTDFRYNDHLPVKGRL